MQHCVSRFVPLKIVVLQGICPVQIFPEFSISCIHFLHFFLQLNTRRRIEVVITSSTRNRVVGDEPARGFDSHRLRQRSASRISACRFPYFLITNLIFEYHPGSVKYHSSFRRIPLSIDNPNARKCWPLCRYRCVRAIFVRY